MNKQREAIYAIRRDLLEGADQREYILELANDIALDLITQHSPREKSVDEWDVDSLRISVGNQFGVDIAALGIDLKDTTYEELTGKVTGKVRQVYEDKEKRIGSEYLRYQERIIMLQVLDAQWKDHLWALDHLKEGIGLRGYGQRDPLIEYKKESFAMFEALNARIEEETIRYLFLFEPISAEEHEAREREREEARRRQMREQNLVYNAGEMSPSAPTRREAAKVGRNDPCPCGSGKKFKKCHGR
jgi:preprotein translocase subunit SecA